jgi:hypothetical protein
MSLEIRRGFAALGLAATLLVTVPAPSWAKERESASVLRNAWGWLASLWPGAFLASSPWDKEGSMIDPNGAVQPASQPRPDEGSMIDPNGGR